jgi:hypothetical protein
MFASGGGLTRLTGVDFISNTAGNSGGGMYNGSPALLTDVTFRSNSAGYGGGLRNNGGAVLVDVTFVNNTATERGGGMDNNGGSPPLVNVRFLGNTADRGGGMGNYYNGDPSLTNSIFVGNRATSSSEGGGGMFNDTNCDVTMTNVSFVANSAARWAGAIWSQYDSEVELANGILWGNTSDAVGNELFFTFIATHTVRYSDLQEVFTGTGNINSDPEFVDADGPDDVYGTLDDNLRLQVTSPAIDAGDNDAVPLDMLDLDGDGVTVEPLPLDLAGRGRFADQPSVMDTGNGSPPIVDMGAYERGHYIFLPLTLRNG